MTVQSRVGLRLTNSTNPIETKSRLNELLVNPQKTKKTFELDHRQNNCFSREIK